MEVWKRWKAAPKFQVSMLVNMVPGLPYHSRWRVQFSRLGMLRRFWHDMLDHVRGPGKYHQYIHSHKILIWYASMSHIYNQVITSHYPSPHGFFVENPWVSGRRQNSTRQGPLRQDQVLGAVNSWDAGASPAVPFLVLCLHGRLPLEYTGCPQGTGQGW